MVYRSGRGAKHSLVLRNSFLQLILSSTPSSSDDPASPPYQAGIVVDIIGDTSNDDKVCFVPWC